MSLNIYMLYAIRMMFAVKKSLCKMKINFPRLFNLLMVSAGSGELKTEFPATRTLTPAPIKPCSI